MGLALAKRPRHAAWDLRTLAAGVAWPLAVTAVLALQLALIALHRPFADEWQAAQIAVQTPDLASLIDNLHYETHPPLWYLFLRALAAVTGGQHVLVAASLLCGLFAQGVILLRSPWPRWVRVAVALSAPILFEFIVVSRGHTLGLALIFAVLALWHRPRLVWLPIALLPAVDFLYGVATLAFMAWRWEERELWWPGMAGWLAVSLLSAWSIVPAPDYIPVYGSSGGTGFALLMAGIRLSVVYLPIQGDLGEFWWNAGPPDPLMLTLWAPLLVTLYVMGRGRWLDLAILLGTAALMYVFSTFLYPFQNRHLWVLTLLMLAVLWRRSEAGEAIHPLAKIWLVLGALAGLYTAWFGLTRTSERSDEISAFIERENLQDEHWVAIPEMAGQGVSALSGVSFEKPGAACMQQFIRWDTPIEMRKPAGYGPLLQAKVAEDRRFFVVSSEDLSGFADLRELRRFGDQLDGKVNRVYVANEEAAGQAAMLPDCVSGLRGF